MVLDWNAAYESRPMDLYGVLESGGMSPLGNWYRFVQLFNGYKNQWGGYEFGMPSPEVPECLKRVILRRLKTEVLKDLHPKTYQRIQVSDMSDALTKRNIIMSLSSLLRSVKV